MPGSPSGLGEHRKCASDSVRVFGVRGKRAVFFGQVDAGSENEGGGPDDELDRVDDGVRVAVEKGMLAVPTAAGEMT